MNKYKDALAYLRNSVLVTDHNQQERVNQCVGILQELVDKATPINPVAMHCENEGEAQNVIEEDIRELQEVKCMKKSDLVAGKHVVKYRDGSVRIVGENGGLFDSEMKKQNTLNCFDENLKDSDCVRGLDIVSVYELTEVWKREEPTITEDEKAILRSLPKEYRFITRDKSGELYIYGDKPKKGYGGVWENGIGNKVFHLMMFNHLFQMVRWEDDEPWKFEDLLNLDVKESE